MTKRLIITADDFGLSEETNKNIMKCFTGGAVTDLSLLAVGDSFEHAVELAGENNIGKTGVHLALTDSLKPVTPAENIPTLVGKNGKFAGGYFEFLAKYFIGMINTSEIYTEFKNQISRIKKAGFAITHLDSHQHIHMIPGILKVVIKLMREEGIGYARFPREKINIFAKIANPYTFIRNFLLLSACNLSVGLLDALGIKHNDYFIGHARALRLRKKDLMRAISNLKAGVTELGCHPGSAREELKVLCDRDFINEIKKRSIELVSY